MTVQDLLYDARSLLDDYNTGGVVLSETETEETDTNALRYINMGLGEVYPYARYFKTHEITQTPTDEQRQAMKWIPYELPSDFGDLDKIVLDDDKYQVDAIIQLEGYNTIYVAWWYEGTFRVVYKPKPTRPTSLTDVLPINNPLAEQFMVYYVAAKIAITDLPDQANYFEQKANELLFKASRPQPARENRIVDVYGINN